MKHALSVGLALTISASQASALSCLRPDVADAFTTASDSEFSYVVLKGTFAFEPLPNTDTPQAQTIDSKFTGKLMTGKGFTDDVTAPVEIDLTCAGPWCATMEPDIEYIAFVQQDEATLIFEVGPCYALAFANPSAEDTKRLEICAAGGACEPLEN